MNILFTSPSFYPRIGGAERLMEDLSERFLNLGHKVTVISLRYSDFPDDIPYQENRKGIDIIRFDYPPDTISSFSSLPGIIWQYWKLLLKYIKVAKGKKIDTLCVGIFWIDAIFAILMKYTCRLRLIFYMHGSEITTTIKINRFVKWVFNQCLRSADAIVVVSNYLRQQVMEWAPYCKNKIIHIPNGVDIAAIRKQPKYIHGRDYILYAGRLEDVKGVDVLLDAVSCYTRGMSGPDLLIAGTGTQEERLKQYIRSNKLEEKVHFLGVQQKEKVFSLIRGSLFMVLPSRSEGLPIILLEAIAAGKIVIASRIDGISEIIKDRRNGLLFEKENSNELAMRIKEYYNNEKKRGILEKDITSFVIEHYDIANIAKKHLEVYAG